MQIRGFIAHAGYVIASNIRFGPITLWPEGERIVVREECLDENDRRLLKNHLSKGDGPSSWNRSQSKLSPVPHRSTLQSLPRAFRCVSQGHSEASLSHYAPYGLLDQGAHYAEVVYSHRHGQRLINRIQSAHHHLPHHADQLAQSEALLDALPHALAETVA
mgnify:CR=1 FL=1